MAAGARGDAREAPRTRRHARGDVPHLHPRNGGRAGGACGVEAVALSLLPISDTRRSLAHSPVDMHRQGLVEVHRQLGSLHNDQRVHLVSGKLELFKGNHGCSGPNQGLPAPNQATQSKIRPSEGQIKAN